MSGKSSIIDRRPGVFAINQLTSCRARKHAMNTASKFLIAALLCCVVGCGDLMSTSKKPRKKPLRRKTTTEIGEFKGDSNVVEPNVQISNPITGALEAYEPLKQQISQLGIEHAIQLFHALEGRYPKDYDEFMQRIIAENNIRLPVLGKGFRYEYDVDNHKLLIVQNSEKPDE